MPRFRVDAKVGPERDRKKEKWRGSRQERGYDGDWDKLRLAYKDKVHGLCEECRRKGWPEFCDVIDHMIPVEDDPAKRLDEWNLDALCHVHHNGWKRKLEDFARKTGAIAMLPMWIKFPETRPAHFQILRYGPAKELFDAEDRAKRLAD